MITGQISFTFFPVSGFERIRHLFRRRRYKGVSTSAYELMYVTKIGTLWWPRTAIAKINKYANKLLK